jgi:hypothetical protein
MAQELLPHSLGGKPVELLASQKENIKNNPSKNAALNFQ